MTDLQKRIDPLMDPAAARCTGCGRKTWLTENIGRPCNLPMPVGKQCFGEFQALESRPTRAGCWALGAYPEAK